ncbi:LOW QUALITY PROTEIN: uncharacterized protein LOC132946911 [Metopolophium dirhodum]|uniref:LOW QUALITY PROTEIN: uncharacterized protein LOC132946911 n=1 Tax=Metopolophium dirhodum TaxID=44670 RepID=UPI0029900E89|nr:LOW QUALITY PROTEIN: uncharacterized protein LOC132946911 [Metopolophium dirhodum]
MYLGMVSTRLMAMALAVVWCCSMTASEQHWKWSKPYTWMSSPKSYSPSYPAVYGKPQPRPYIPSGHDKHRDRCELRKAVFTQDANSPQYIVYKTKIPDLKEFTLCHWHNIFNYTHDQPIFSYTHPGKPRVIYSWIENKPDKTYYSLAINGHTIYRINYPEKLFKWYHVCQSWNGHTGEWQLWINSERVGRGFYNLMAGKKIKGGGVAISGREYVEQALAVHYPAFSGELTLVSLYKAALTAGKAYNDHKHHHVHNFHHGYDESVDEADTEAPPTLPPGPEATRPPHLAHGGAFANGQRVPGVAVPNAAGPAPQQPPTMPLHLPQLPPSPQLPLFDGGLYDFYDAPHADETFRVNLLDKRSDDNRRSSLVRYKRSWMPLFRQPMSDIDVVTDADATSAAARNARSNDGDPHDRKREPAEWEVVKVAGVCAACVPDPFGAASVLSWHETRKQFYNGALYLPALPKCYLF